MASDDRKRVAFYWTLIWSSLHVYRKRLSLQSACTYVIKHNIQAVIIGLGRITGTPKNRKTEPISQRLLCPQAQVN